jgi:SAM-dependent methyltransferase
MLPDLATGGGKDMHEQQYIFLVHECGLEKNDLFLDIGTGSLRGSKKVITYLEKNHFYGMDISEELISFAKNRVSKNLDLMQKEPYLEIDDRFRFSRAFPYVHDKRPTTSLNSLAFWRE